LRDHRDDLPEPDSCFEGSTVPADDSAFARNHGLHGPTLRKEEKWIAKPQWNFSNSRKSLAKEECDDDLPDLRIDIAQKAIQAYTDYTGRPMDLYLLAA
jgi:hypothetical protein